MVRTLAFCVLPLLLSCWTCRGDWEQNTCLSSCDLVCEKKIKRIYSLEGSDLIILFFSFILNFIFYEIHLNSILLFLLEKVRKKESNQEQIKNRMKMKQQSQEHKMTE